MNFKMFIPIVISYLLSTVAVGLLIPVLRRLKFGQQVRTDGVQDHLVKQGTPTMGGIGFLLVILLVSLVFGFIYKADAERFLPVVIMTVGFGFIGFLDDFLKIKKKQSEGLKAWQKLACQLLLTVGFAVYCYLSPAIGTKVVIPFTGGKTWDMGWLYIPFVILAVLGTDNGTNLTDGVDGLLGSVTTVVAFFLMYMTGKVSGGVSLVSGITAGALMGYLHHNSYPAKVFMGDTGSLAIGAFVSAAAIVTGMGWFILIFGLLYFIEVLSVIMQVGYFKITHGKRIFKMAPIHHHFEKSGFSETWVVVSFTIFTLFACALAALAM